jgi:hypothetical protein
MPYNSIEDYYGDEDLPEEEDKDEEWEMNDEDVERILGRLANPDPILLDPFGLEFWPSDSLEDDED